MVLQPEYLGDLHLDGHLPTDISKQIMLGGIDLGGLLHRTVVKPKDDIAVRIKVRSCDGDGLVVGVRENGQRTRSIKGNSANSLGIEIVLTDGALDGYTDAAPDVGGRLLVKTLLRLPEADVLRGQADNITFLINYAGTRAASTDINADVQVLVDEQLVTWISGSTTDSLLRGAVGQRSHDPVVVVNGRGSHSVLWNLQEEETRGGQGTAYIERERGGYEGRDAILPDSALPGYTWQPSAFLFQAHRFDKSIHRLPHSLSLLLLYQTTLCVRVSLLYTSAMLPLALLLLSILPFTVSLSVDILSWPLAASAPTPLARVSYDPAAQASQLLSYNPPSDDGNLIRIGVASSISANPDLWAASLTSPASLTPSKDRRPLLRLHLGPAGEVYYVSVSVDSRNATDSTNPGVELVQREAGPRPQLNRPIVLGPDGRNPEEAVEKTFFQK